MQLKIKIPRVVPIKGFPDYKVSETGNVYSRKNRHGGIGDWKKLRPRVSSNGYFQVDLHKDGKSFTSSIHRLVLEAFIGPCPGGMECRHRDGNPCNNNLNNLVWGTKTENQADKKLHGTNKGPRGEIQGRSKLVRSQVLEIRSKYMTGLYAQRELAAAYGVSYGLIYSIVNYITWRHVE